MLQDIVQRLLRDPVEIRFCFRVDIFQIACRLKKNLQDAMFLSFLAEVFQRKGYPENFEDRRHHVIGNSPDLINGYIKLVF